MPEQLSGTGSCICTCYEIKGSIDELKKTVADGKVLIASAVTNKGVATAPDDAFAVMAANIGTIQTDVKHSVYAQAELSGNGTDLYIRIYKDGKQVCSTKHSQRYGTFDSTTVSI